MADPEQQQQPHESVGGAPREEASSGALLPEWAPGAIALLVLILVAFSPALRAGFVWDDDFNVTQNPALRSLAGLAALWLEPGTTTQYYPLVYTSFWLEYQAWGLAPFGYHLDNILLHALNAIVLWRLLVLLGVPGAWVAAAVFGLHPVQVDTVAWVTERKNLLATLFYLLAAYTYLSRVSGAVREPPARIAPALAATLALFVAALLSKVTMATLGPALGVVVWWKLGRLPRRELALLGTLCALAIPIGLLTASLESGLGETLGFEWRPTLLERLIQATHSVWFYLGKLAWPFDIAFSYRRFEIDAGDPLQYGWALALASALVAAWLGRERVGRAPLAALLFFVGTLTPVLGFLEIYYFRFSYVADHWQYVACIGPIALCIGGGATRVAHWPGSAGAGRLAFGAAAALLTALAALTWQQSWTFRNSETLWRSSLEKNPESLLARFNLGVELHQQDRLDQSYASFEHAGRLSPESAIVHAALAGVRGDQGRVDEAIALYRRALELDSELPRAHWNLGRALESKGLFDEALPHLERGLLKPHPHPSERLRLIRSHSELGDMLVRYGRPDAAIPHYRSSLANDPTWASARLGLGRALLAAGQAEQAFAELQAAAQLMPGDAEALRLLEVARVRVRLERGAR